jgi:hypothetical protein
MKKLITAIFIFSFLLYADESCENKLKVQPYGFFKLDMSYDSDLSSLGNFARWALPNSDDAIPTTNITAKQSRFGMNIAKGDIAGKVEIDFYGVGSAENKGGVLLRKAYAEAKFELGQFDQLVADATINVIRDRVSLPGITVGEHSNDELQALIRNERKVELAFEGFRYFDIKRWKTAEHIMNNNYIIGRYKQSVVTDMYQNGYVPPRPTFDEYGISHYPNEQDLFEKIPLEYSFDPARDYLWPIPQTEREVVPTLTQNPGY